MYSNSVSLIFHQFFTFVDKNKQKHLDSIKSSSKFLYSRRQSQYIYLIPYVSHVLTTSPNLHFILCILLEKLLTRFDNELAINFGLSKNCNMY